MSVNCKETIRDPNSFGNIDYELLIDFRLTVDGYLHNTPPVKEFSWEEFQKELNEIEEEKKICFHKYETYLDAVTFEQKFRCLIRNGEITNLFITRSYFNVLNENTLNDLKETIRWMGSDWAV